MGKGTRMTKDEALKLALETLECWQRNEDCNEPMSKILEAIKKALAQPEQEPVAWEQFYPDIGKPQIEQPKVRTGDCLLVGVCASEGHKIAPQRTWVGLDEEDDIDWEEGGSLRDLVEAIEAKLKQKNGYAEEKNTRGQE